MEFQRFLVFRLRQCTDYESLLAINRLPVCAAMQQTISLSPHINERQPSVKRFHKGSVYDRAINSIALFRNAVFNDQSGQYVHVCNTRNMHAMYHRFYFPDTWSSRVSI
jgi:hypothetical protein